MKEELIDYILFKIGDRVKIKYDSRFYLGEPDQSNPKDVPGEITKMDNEWISVLFENGRRNSYPHNHLELEISMVYPKVNANRIYLGKTPNSLTYMFNLIWDRSGRSNQTYYKLEGTGDLVLQCVGGKMRSFDDIWIIADTYFPEIDVADIFKELMLWNVTSSHIKEGFLWKGLANCSTMKRIRFTNSPTKIDVIWKMVDSDKFESVYYWRDLFNMLYINTKKQFIDWITEEVNARELANKKVNLKKVVESKSMFKMVRNGKVIQVS